MEAHDADPGDDERGTDHVQPFAAGRAGVGFAVLIAGLLVAFGVPLLTAVL